jgi:hypothetical protein
MRFMRSIDRSTKEMSAMSPPSPSLLLLHRTHLPVDSIEHKVVPMSSSDGVQATGFDEAVDPAVLG